MIFYSSHLTYSFRRAMPNLGNFKTCIPQLPEFLGQQCLKAAKMGHSCFRKTTFSSFGTWLCLLPQPSFSLDYKDKVLLDRICWKTCKNTQKSPLRQVTTELTQLLSGLPFSFQRNSQDCCGKIPKGRHPHQPIRALQRTNRIWKLYISKREKSHITIEETDAETDLFPQEPRRATWKFL